MRTQLSPQIRIFALVGVLLIALAGAGLFVLRHSHSGAAPAPPAARSTRPAATTPARTTATPTTPARTTAQPPTRLHLRQVRIDPSLPAPLRAALLRHRTVVVGLYDPQVRFEATVLTAARDGAAQAHAGFVRVSLLDNRVAGPLTGLLPSGNLLPSPGILVYRRPGKLVYRFDGYLDRDAVALVASRAK